MSGHGKHGELLEKHLGGVRVRATEDVCGKCTTGKTRTWAENGCH
jgi:hypothetical protein